MQQLLKVSLGLHGLLLAGLAAAMVLRIAWLPLPLLALVAVNGALTWQARDSGLREVETSGAALRLQARFLQDKLRELTTLHEVAQGFIRLESPHASYRFLVEKLADLLRLSRCALFMLDEERLELAPQPPTYGISPAEAEGLRISLSEGQLTRRFWQSTEPVYFNDLNISADPDAAELRQWFGSLKVKSVIGQTVWVGQQPVGIIFGFDKEDGSRFAPDDSRLIAILATQASVAINNSRLFDQVQMDLEVKTALLQEINHRVRNNLASIVGLLSMELMRPEPQPARAVLMNSINRVKSIGQVHTMLSEDSFGVVDFRSIAEAIVGFVTASWADGRSVDVDVSGDPIVLDPKRASSLALVVNELITNALKYAFPNDRAGRVEIHSQVEEGEATVVVRDDGIGMPPGFDPESAPSLGMRIVRNLVRTDLKGRFELHTEAGTVATIAFPVAPKLQATEPLRELARA
ncbi:MAG TPA: histidine kinase dimerization/phosphoacceptor domain -containing protein [Chloroflexota bacterium]|nr:histidine kinase dimerization/phosphoacceptor domain -containing protein [Chloroflexota bacterium]